MSAWLGATSLDRAAERPRNVCVRPEPGSTITEPEDLRSRDGILETDLRIVDQKLPDGTIRYCYLTPDGKPSPTLRVKPGDQLIIHFKNDLTEFDAATPVIGRSLAGAQICTAKKSLDPCESGAMTPVSTNLHFHGLTVPPACHQDEVLKTSIQPDDAPFEYRLHIPA
ncbi:MAG: hypothetical protein KGJ00_04480, partial [Bradyrhizobium sp.]|nr:hypothetical protein [Bradyrhizobium sp.]